MIIGVTGTLGAGKGTLVEYLQTKGFEHYSVRGFLNERLSAEGKENTRDNMVTLANKLRAENSPSYIAEQLFEQASKKGGDAVIESLRAVGEVESLRAKGNFYLLAVDADSKTRYERIKKRASSTDNVSYEEFVAQEQREMSSADPNKQNISKCINLADIVLLNNESIEDFYFKVEKYTSFDSEGFLKRRPTWDEIFMREAYTWASRSSCIRRKVGAVISTPDHAIISQGYNGSPRGNPNCIDLGYCERQRNNIPSGQRLEECNAVHAEPNAIMNAGRQGKSVQGDILYCTHFPCQICAGIIVNAGISEVVFDSDYPGEKAKETFSKAAMKLKQFEGVRSSSFDKLFRQR